MPINFSLFAFVNSCIWMTYFLLDKDFILAVPSIHILTYFSVHLQIFILCSCVKAEFYTVLYWSMQCPNILGVPLGIGQIVLYCMYRKQPSLKVDQFNPEIGMEENANADKTNSAGQQIVEIETQ